MYFDQGVSYFPLSFFPLAPVGLGPIVVFSIYIPATLFFVTLIFVLCFVGRSLSCNTAQYKQLGEIEADLEEGMVKLLSSQLILFHQFLPVWLSDHIVLKFFVYFLCIFNTLPCILLLSLCFGSACPPLTLLQLRYILWCFIAYFRIISWGLTCAFQSGV